MRRKENMPQRRALLAAACGLLLPFAEAKTMKVALSVVLFSYLDRPIFDAFIDGKAGQSSGVYPYTGGGAITNVTLELGPKKVSWRLGGPQGMPRNGETVFNKNPLMLSSVVAGAKYLAIHIYPDDTVELITTVHFPEVSTRGQGEIARLEQQHG